MLSKLSVKFCLLLFISSFSYSVSAQTDSLPYPPKADAWYDTFSIGGYVQARYNRLFETNPDLECAQGD
jgi:hypothetical protein